MVRCARRCPINVEQESPQNILAAGRMWRKKLEREKTRSWHDGNCNRSLGKGASTKAMSPVENPQRRCRATTALPNTKGSALREAVGAEKRSSD